MRFGRLIENILSRRTVPAKLVEPVRILDSEDTVIDHDSSNEMLKGLLRKMSRL